MTGTDPKPTVNTTIVRSGDLAQCALFIISNYILMSYGAKRAEQSLLTRDPYTYRIGLQKR